MPADTAPSPIVTAVVTALYGAAGHPRHSGDPGCLRHLIRSPWVRVAARRWRGGAGLYANGRSASGKPGPCAAVTRQIARKTSIPRVPAVHCLSTKTVRAYLGKKVPGELDGVWLLGSSEVDMGGDKKGVRDVLLERHSLFWGSRRRPNADVTKCCITDREDVAIALAASGAAVIGVASGRHSSLTPESVDAHALGIPQPLHKTTAKGLVFGARKLVFVFDDRCDRCRACSRSSTRRRTRGILYYVHVPPELLGAVDSAISKGSRSTRCTHPGCRGTVRRTCSQRAQEGQVDRHTRSVAHAEVFAESGVRGTSCSRRLRVPARRGTTSAGAHHPIAGAVNGPVAARPAEGDEFTQQACADTARPSA